MILQEIGGFSIQRIFGIGLGEQLGQKSVDNVAQTKHGTPLGIQTVETNGSTFLVDVRVLNLFDKPTRWTAKGIIVGQCEADVILSAFVGSFLGTVHQNTAGTLINIHSVGVCVWEPG